LEGCKPSKKPPFLVVFAGEAGKYHQKKKIVGRLRHPNPHHRVTRIVYYLA